MANDDVTDRKGIYTYVLCGDEKFLNIRAFSENQRRAAYERQKGICANPKCGKHFELKDMHADHIDPWSKGGATSADNCRMLCRRCNLEKSDK